jgi:hypothetical protein
MVAPEVGFEPKTHRLQILCLSHFTGLANFY